MKVNIQPTLENELLKLSPLEENDFEKLYAVANDPLIWEQHPNNDRWKKEVFLNFFEGALKSGGAFKIIDKRTGNWMGSTRFYEYNEEKKSILIGYTFYARAYWGKGINPAVKKLMLDYIFQFVEDVYFHIGSKNFRSQVAIGRLGATKIREIEVAYYGEPTRTNFEYHISKTDWMKNPK